MRKCNSVTFLKANFTIDTEKHLEQLLLRKLHVKSIISFLSLYDFFKIQKDALKIFTYYDALLLVSSYKKHNII